MANAILARWPRTQRDYPMTRRTSGETSAIRDAPQPGTGHAALHRRTTDRRQTEAAFNGLARRQTPARSGTEQDLRVRVGTREALTRVPATMKIIAIAPERAAPPPSKIAMKCTPTGELRGRDRRVQKPCHGAHTPTASRVTHIGSKVIERVLTNPVDFLDPEPHEPHDSDR
jgi:hypothetical protein